MVKRNNSGKRSRGAAATTTNASSAATPESAEQRVLAFAEQIGRVAGTFQAKADGWMDRETLSRQLASVRDGAADLLKQLAGDATMTSKKKAARAVVRGGSKARSGGKVDAQGKQHRKRMPTDPDATRAESQAAKLRSAKPTVPTKRYRRRG